MEVPKFIVLESPWAGLQDFPKAKAYLKTCIRDCLWRNEIPWASHAILAWTEALDEFDPDQRYEGIEWNKQMILKAEYTVFYLDHGMTEGMKNAYIWAVLNNKKVLKRKLWG